MRKKIEKITILVFVICFLFLFNIEKTYAKSNFDPGVTSSGLGVSGNKYTLKCAGATLTFKLLEVSDNNESKSDCGGAAGIFWDSTKSNRIKKLTKKLNEEDAQDHYVLWGHSVTYGATKTITLSINKSGQSCSGSITVKPAGRFGGNNHLAENSSFKFELDVAAEETEVEENFTSKINVDVKKYMSSDGDNLGNYYLEIDGTTKAIAKAMTNYAVTGTEEDKQAAEQLVTEQVTEGGTLTEVKIFETTTLNGAGVSGSQQIQCDTGLKDFINEYWKYIMVITPILLMVMMSLDFAKAIFSSDSELVQKASSNSIKRVLAAVLLLCLPLIVDTILSFFGLELCF